MELRDYFRSEAELLEDVTGAIKVHQSRSPTAFKQIIDWV